MDFTPLRRHRDYRLLYMAQSVSFLGTMMTYVALPYQMFQLTHSSLQVGLLGLAELIPLLLTAFIGGALADSLDRKRLVIVTDVFLSCGSLALALLAWHGAPPVWSLYVLAGFMSAMSGLQRPSIDAMMPRLVPREDLMAAAALGSFRGSLIMIVDARRLHDPATELKCRQMPASATLLCGDLIVVAKLCSSVT